MKDRRLYHSVAKKILKLIDTGVFPRGGRLPGERELAERFGVSRVTIREAEISLQAQGYLKIKTGSGVYVLETPPDNFAKLPNVSAFELTEARLLFESEAAALAARDIDAETLDYLEACVVRMRDHTNAAETEEADEADKDFHLTIAKAANNEAVRYMIEMLWKMRSDIEPVRKAYDSICGHDGQARSDEHREVLDALRAHEPEAARVAMRTHFTRILESMIDVTEEQAFEEVRKKVTESRERFLKTV